MPYSLKEAAEATGKSKPTILRAINAGKVSAAKDAHGEWQIEPAELHRVYPPVTERNVPDETPWNDTQHPNFAFETGMLRGEIEQLRERLALINVDREHERREASQQIEDLKRRLDQSEVERRSYAQQVTALLTDQRPKEQEAPGMTTAPAMPPGFLGRARYLLTGKI